MAYHPGAWVQCYDDTPAKDSTKAASKPGFLPAFVRKKQRDCCAVCFSLQAFKGTRQRDTVVSFRNLGVDVDLVAPEEWGKTTAAEIDRRKNAYLEQILRPFPLKPHWLIETQDGFHVIFRVQPRQDSEGIQLGEAVNRRLLRVLKGDESRDLLTQMLSIPGLYQFKDPLHPFLCRLLVDDGEKHKPYALEEVSTVLDALEVFGEKNAKLSPVAIAGEPSAKTKRKWQEGLSGAEEGKRGATAASLVGKILWHVPEELWETAGWGGLLEWNQRNRLPLPERELRTIFESIAKREAMKRQAGTQGGIRQDPTQKLFPQAGAEKTIVVQSPCGSPHAQIRIDIQWRPCADPAHLPSGQSTHGTVTGADTRNGNSQSTIASPSPDAGTR